MNVVLSEKLNVLEKVKTVLKGGHILAIYRECDSIFAGNICKELVRDYRVSTKLYPSNVENDIEVVDDIMDTEDDVRMVLCFGGLELIEAGKVASTMLGVPLVIYLTSAINVIEDSGYIFVDGVLEVRHTVSPRLVMTSSEYIAKRDGYDGIVGEVAERIIMAFDEIFKGVIGGNGVQGRAKLDDIVRIASGFHENNRVDMLEKCLNIETKSASIITEMTNILSYNSEVKISESVLKFPICYVMALLYKAYIDYDGDDLMLPPDIVQSARAINDRFAKDIGSSISQYKMMTSLEYMRATHMLGEYRAELSHIITSITEVFERLAKVYRRVSKDAGYRMFEDISLDSILENISLISIFERENTPLRLMKNAGYLEHYLENNAV